MVLRATVFLISPGSLPHGRDPRPVLRAIGRISVDNISEEFSGVSSALGDSGNPWAAPSGDANEEREGEMENPGGKNAPKSE